MKGYHLIEVLNIYPKKHGFFHAWPSLSELAIMKARLEIGKTKKLTKQLT